MQFHGARLLLEQKKAPPPPAQPRNVPALISEVDSTWLKAQPRRRQGPVRHSPVHLGLHSTGRARRSQARGSTRLRLTDKHRLVSTAPLALFGHLLGHREGLDAWRQIPAALRHGHRRTPPTVKSGSGAVEKNIEIAINRRFKRQGRSWHPGRAARLLALHQPCAQPSAWNAGWKTKPQFHFKPHPP